MPMQNSSQKEFDSFVIPRLFPVGLGCEGVWRIEGEDPANEPTPGGGTTNQVLDFIKKQVEVIGAVQVVKDVVGDIVKELKKEPKGQKKPWDHVVTQMKSANYGTTDAKKIAITQAGFVTGLEAYLQTKATNHSQLVATSTAFYKKWKGESSYSDLVKNQTQIATSKGTVLQMAQHMQTYTVSGLGTPPFICGSAPTAAASQILIEIAS